MVFLALAQIDDGSDRITQVSVAGRLATPWRTIHTDNAVIPNSQNRIVIIQQLTSFNIINPKSAMGAFARTAFTQKEIRLAILHGDRSVHHQGVFACRGEGKHQNHHRADREPPATEDSELSMAESLVGNQIGSHGSFQNRSNLHEPFIPPLKQLDTRHIRSFATHCNLLLVSSIRHRIDQLCRKHTTLVGICLEGSVRAHLIPSQITVRHDDSKLVTRYLIDFLHRDKFFAKIVFFLIQWHFESKI